MKHIWGMEIFGLRILSKKLNCERAGMAGQSAARQRIFADKGAMEIGKYQGYQPNNNYISKKGLLFFWK
jgi:hypothetical protein